VWVALVGLMLTSAVPPTDIAWGTGGDGTASDLWTAAIAREVGDNQARALQAKKLPIDAKQMAWAGIILKQKQAFAERRLKLDAAFDGNLGRVRILLGNRGTRDAFSHGDDVIAINLARWQEVYGDASDAQAERVQRILAHEYTHLLTREYKRKRQLVATTPLDRALWTLFDEGLANYRSLSDKYKPLAPDKPSKAASVALTRHAEKLATTLAMLDAGPAPADEEKLLEGMVSGAFEDKWGALPVALWIANEVSADKSEDVVLKRLIRAGPSGILTLARRNLPPDVAAKLPGTRASVTAPTMKAIEAPADDRKALDALRR
jgi:hypothetical protein